MDTNTHLRVLKNSSLKSLLLFRKNMRRVVVSIYRSLLFVVHESDRITKPSYKNALSLII